MQQAGQVLDSIKRRQEKARRLEGIEAGPKRSYRRDAVDDYRSEMAGLIKRYGDDLSRCDFIAAMKLASNGREPDEIAKAMAEAVLQSWIVRRAMKLITFSARCRR